MNHQQTTPQSPSAERRIPKGGVCGRPRSVRCGRAWGLGSGAGRTGPELAPSFQSVEGAPSGAGPQGGRMPTAACYRAGLQELLVTMETKLCSLLFPVLTPTHPRPSAFLPLFLFFVFHIAGPDFLICLILNLQCVALFSLLILTVGRRWRAPVFIRTGTGCPRR